VRLAAILLALLPTPAFAQAYQCAPPARLEPVRPVRPDGPVIRAAIARYTLALSWSPEFCRGKGGKGGGNDLQCGRANGQFGFVLHGLWPEARSGPAPQWCSFTPRPSPQVLRQNLCMSPSAWLLEHEWAKHGSCMTKTPEGYFRVAGILWQSLRFTEMDVLSLQPNLTAGDMRRAFVSANRGWKPEAVGVFTGSRGWLRELKLCYDRDFKPQACPRGGFGAANNAPLKIWRGT
jgi:ribonuclease T2